MTEDIISRIDQAVGCQQCTRALKPDGPSVDFCSEECQRAWHAERAAKQWPNSDDFERAPAGPWGGQGPPGWREPLGSPGAWMFTPAAPLFPRPGDTVAIELGDGTSFEAVVEERANPALGRPVDERVAAVERLASHAGITLSAWQRQAIEVMYAGGTVLWPRRAGRRTIAALMQAEADQRGIRGHHADEVIVDEPFAMVHADHEDCRCELLGEVEEAALALSRQMHPGAEVSIEIEDRGPDGIYVSELVEYPRNPMRGWLAKWFNRVRGDR